MIHRFVFLSKNIKSLAFSVSKLNGINYLHLCERIFFETIFFILKKLKNLVILEILIFISLLNIKI